LPFEAVLEQVSERLNRPEMRGHATSKPQFTAGFRASVRL
jgi:hypothetical protein